MIVADASIVIELALGEDTGIVFAQLMQDAGELIAAPHFLDLEVAQALRRLALRGSISADDGTAALSLLGDLPITRYSHEPLIDRIWQLRSNVTAYDASYIALAEGLDATLWTRDARLASVPGMRAQVEVM